MYRNSESNTTADTHSDQSCLKSPTTSPLNSMFRMGKRKLVTRFGIGIAGLLVGVFLLYIASTKIDIASSFNRMQSANLAFVVIGTVLYFIGYVARIFRWFYLSNNRGLKVKLWDSTSAIMGSLALNCLIPARLGEFWRVARTSEDRKSLLAPVPLGAMFVERITDLIVVVIAATLFVSPTLSWLGSSSSYSAWLFGGLITVFSILVGFIFFISIGQMIRLRKVQEWVSKLGIGAIPRKSDILPLTLLSMAVWICEFSFLILVLRSVNISIPVLAGYGVAAFYALISAIPISQAGIGQADLGALELLKLNQSIDLNAVGAALIILRLVNIGGVAILGVVTTVIDAVFTNFGMGRSND